MSHWAVHNPTGSRMAPLNKTFKLKNHFMELQIISLKLMSLWPWNLKKYLPSFLSGLSAPINGLYILFWHFVCFHVTIFHYVSLHQKWDQGLDELSGLIMTSIIYTFMYFIMCYFQIKYRSHRDLYEFMEKEFQNRSAPGICYVTAEPAYLENYKYYKYWLIACVGGTLHTAFIPILIWKKSLPLSCWYPFDVIVSLFTCILVIRNFYYSQNSPWFPVAYLLQIFCQIQVGLNYGLSSGIFMSMVIAICGQYDILYSSLKNIRYTAMIRHDGNRAELLEIQKAFKIERMEINQYYNAVEFLEDFDDLKNQSVELFHPNNDYLSEYSVELSASLADCVRHHQMILKFCEMLEQFYSKFVMVKLLEASFLICFLAYLASSVIICVSRLIYRYLFLPPTEIRFSDETSNTSGISSSRFIRTSSFLLLWRSD